MIGTPSRTHALPLAVAAVIVLLPLGDTTVPGLGISLVYVAMVVPAGMVLWKLVTDDARIPSSMILLGLGLAQVGSLVSAAGSVAPDRSVPLVVSSFITLGYAIALVIAFRPGLEVHGPELLVVVGGLIAAMALVSVGSLQAIEGGNVIIGRLTGPFAQPNELGMFCGALLPVAVACLVTAASRRRQVVLGLASVCLATAWGLSMSRGAWIGGVTALVCLAVCEPATRRVIAAAGLAGAATCAAAVVAPANTAVLGVIGARIRSLGDPTQNQYDDRPLIWAEAWRQATEHPWFGTGPGAYQTVATQSSSAVSARPADHPHDLFLTILTERGVVGVALAVVVVVGCVTAARRHVLAGPRFGLASDATRTRSLAVIAALTAVAVHGAFDMPLRNPIVTGLVWTLLGMAIVAETQRATVPGARDGTSRLRPPSAARTGAGAGRKW